MEKVWEDTCETFLENHYENPRELPEEIAARNSGESSVEISRELLRDQIPGGTLGERPKKYLGYYKKTLGRTLEPRYKFKKESRKEFMQ